MCGWWDGIGVEPPVACRVVAEWSSALDLGSELLSCFESTKIRAVNQLFFAEPKLLKKRYSHGVHMGLPQTSQVSNPT